MSLETICSVIEILRTVWNALVAFGVINEKIPFFRRKKGWKRL